METTKRPMTGAHPIASPAVTSKSDLTRPKPVGGEEIEDWGESDHAPPPAVLVHIGGIFSASGDPDAIRRIHERASLFHLLENALLALLAFSMFCIAAWVMIYAPQQRNALVPWIVVPSCALSFGLGGFAAFSIKATKSGFSVDANASAKNPPRGKSSTKT